MILFGAALEKKASDEQLRDALAIVFSVVHDAVKIIHSITEIKDDLITCCVYEQSERRFLTILRGLPRRSTIQCGHFENRHLVGDGARNAVADRER